MRVLVMDGAPTGADAQAVIACLVVRDGVPAMLDSRIATGRGAAEQFPQLATELFARCGWTHSMPELIGVVVGPGSFTGLRASLAFAHGLAAGSGCAVVGVTTGEAMRDALQAAAQPLCARPLWCTIARRGRVFIEMPGAGADTHVSAHMLDALDLPPGPLLLAGNGAQWVKDAVPERQDVHLLPLPQPDPLAIAATALRRWQGALPSRAAQPLYVDAPEAKLPAAGLRPAPAGSAA
ncbi:tRNA (adenosine(37)-N6)-threonylcarbamoyltransferase complex dimerization subunit type 1 TsaB [Komagataeibacter rhaeticus]|uniref:tRNA (Adenosine(37)-N6)-threonylcarbamoyltransferase complex dimerization subunit type 1 TsaB n=1 Tax=Komagataeibacter rhaeticus TaxID=215221 RepID=A0A181C6N9_9PROT|nr:tRNA (adenosine(37)-N6)-threonylcarbamoyltransferase complex dimerization subunit type 1 TsaB [Komagataeibacter rhaeticus]ATU73887.1 tRNA (adenosine(37)-N6)-threonylcarbamoyltransferase complex dimerization subunit type 1 TsaB [Komagataeibacter xylinus]QIP34221.1 tRNA (adenosine(37)-N6)-threonylcarbamoyltransferase complex dimerization subunit type 1 TsaB [Komagataeibacter rhaeticus]QOC46730.1 tRNA (adenosine(37)-N6)-threonylcarbamoyltransferase complex dimerization subunit type 1 TsaB [Komag